MAKKEPLSPTETLALWSAGIERHTKVSLAIESIDDSYDKWSMYQQSAFNNLVTLHPDIIEQAMKVKEELEKLQEIELSLLKHLKKDVFKVR